MGASLSFTVNKSQNDAYSSVLNAIETNGADVTSQIPPSRAEFTLQKKDLMTKFLGEARINILQNGQTSISLEVNPDTGSLALIGIGGLIFSILIGVINPILFIIGICIIGVFFYMVWQDTPDKLVKKMRDTIISYGTVYTPGPTATGPVVSQGGRFCSSCGQRIEADAKFCSHCGANQ